MQALLQEKIIFKRLSCGKKLIHFHFFLRPLPRSLMVDPLGVTFGLWTNLVFAASLTLGEGNTRVIPSALNSNWATLVKGRNLHCPHIRAFNLVFILPSLMNFCPKTCKRLGSSHYIVWLTRSEKGVLCLVGEKKIKILIFGHVGGKNKKIMKCQFFFLVRHNFTASEDLVNQTI